MKLPKIQPGLSGYTIKKSSIAANNDNTNDTTTNDPHDRNEIFIPPSPVTIPPQQTLETLVTADTTESSNTAIDTTPLPVVNQVIPLEALKCDICKENVATSFCKFKGCEHATCAIVSCKISHWEKVHNNKPVKG